MHPRLRTLTSFLIVIGSIVALHYLGWIRPLERGIGAIINPLSSGIYQWSVTATDGTTSLQDAQQLHQSYNDLLLRYQEALVDKADLMRAEEENALLRDLGNFQARTEHQLMGARVIGKDIDPLGSTILINRGARDGLAIGQPAIIGDGILIGLVHDVDEETATILLLDDSQSKVGATVLGETRSIGLVEGGFGLSIRMNFIPQNEEIRVGDTVVTSGLTENIVDGLVIGTVEAVEREAYQPFQTAVVAPAAELDRLILISVIIS